MLYIFAEFDATEVQVMAVKIIQSYSSVLVLNRAFMDFTPYLEVTSKRALYPKPMTGVHGGSHATPLSGLM